MDSLDTDLLRDAMEQVHVISLDFVELGPDLTYEEEPISILDRKILKFRPKELVSVKVQ